MTRAGLVREPPTAVFDVPSFCRAHGISQAFFYKLKSQGLGPTELKLGSRIFVTFESAERWRMEREKATEKVTA
jgi:hypothetical protein